MLAFADVNRRLGSRLNPQAGCLRYVAHASSMRVRGASLLPVARVQKDKFRRWPQSHNLSLRRALKPCFSFRRVENSFVLQLLVAGRDLDDGYLLCFGRHSFLSTFITHPRSPAPLVVSSHARNDRHRRCHRRSEVRSSDRVRRPGVAVLESETQTDEVRFPSLVLARSRLRDSLCRSLCDDR